MSFLKNLFIGEYDDGPEPGVDCDCRERSRAHRIWCQPCEAWSDECDCMDG